MPSKIRSVIGFMISEAYFIFIAISRFLFYLNKKEILTQKFYLYKSKKKFQNIR